MKRFYVFKDGTQQGSTATRELAVDLICQYQKLETHPFLRAEFSICLLYTSAGTPKGASTV